MGRASVDFADDSWPFTVERVCQGVEYARQHGLTREWRDATTPGLSLRVGPSAASYYGRIRVAGKMTARKLGPAYGPGRLLVDDARRQLTALRLGRLASDDRGHTGPKTSRKTPDTTPALGPVVDAYMAAHAAGEWLPGNRTRVPTDRTMENYSNIRRAHLNRHEGLTLRGFADQLHDIHKALRATAPVQADRFSQLVRNIYGYARATGKWGEANPADGTAGKALPKTGSRHRTRVLSDLEWQRLDAAMDARPGQQLWNDLFRVSLSTLQRMGAVCHMCWDDVHLAGRQPMWRIPARHMKGRRHGHVVPLDALPEVVAILKRRLRERAEGCLWVFPAAKGVGPATAYAGPWDRLIKRAGLWNADAEIRPRPHDLRRTGGSQMTLAGVPLQTVVRALGDAPSSAGMVAAVYAQVSDDALRGAYAAKSRIVVAKKSRGEKSK